MTFKMNVARCDIIGQGPHTQSHYHNEPKLTGESPEDYDKRTFRSKLNVEQRDWALAPDAKKDAPSVIADTVVLPAFGMKCSIVDGAKYSQRSIQGKGAAKWSKKFEAGISIPEAPALFIDPKTVMSILVFVHVNGIRGSGKRVPRHFPVILAGWTASFEVWILDPAITRSIFEDMFELAGMFVGIGSYRPQSGGTNGRYQLTNLEWEDKREFIPPPHKFMNSRQPGVVH